MAYVYFAVHPNGGSIPFQSYGAVKAYNAHHERRNGVPVTIREEFILTEEEEAAVDCDSDGYFLPMED